MKLTEELETKLREYCARYPDESDEETYVHNISALLGEIDRLRAANEGFRALLAESVDDETERLTARIKELEHRIEVMDEMDGIQCDADRKKIKALEQAIARFKLSSLTCSTLWRHVNN